MNDRAKCLSEFETFSPFKYPNIQSFECMNLLIKSVFSKNCNFALQTPKAKKERGFDSFSKRNIIKCARIDTFKCLHIYDYFRGYKMVAQFSLYEIALATGDSLSTKPRVSRERLLVWEIDSDHSCAWFVESSEDSAAGHDLR